MMITVETGIAIMQKVATAAREEMPPLAESLTPIWEAWDRAMALIFKASAYTLEMQTMLLAAFQFGYVLRGMIEREDVTI